MAVDPSCDSSASQRWIVPTASSPTSTSSCARSAVDLPSGQRPDVRSLLRYAEGMARRGSCTPQSHPGRPLATLRRLGFQPMLLYFSTERYGIHPKLTGCFAQNALVMAERRPDQLAFELFDALL